jgi:hypothetical protein
MPFIVLSMIAAGGISIAFYMRLEPEKVVKVGAGLRIGALAGLFGFLINALLSTLSMLVASNRAALRSEMMTRWKEAMASSSSDPQTTEMLRRIGDQLKTPSGLAFIFTFGLLVLAAFFIIFGGLGGAIGATLFGRHHHDKQH